MRFNSSDAPLLVSLAFWLPLSAAFCASGPAVQSKGLSHPFVVWADGQEVEIRFHLEKTQALGLTLKDLEEIKFMRFLGKDWTRKLGKIDVDVKTVADLKFRPLQAPPFEVKLPDGKTAIITPKAEKIVQYMVTGKYFQQDVVDVLKSPFVDEPAKAIVLQNLVVFGNLPHATGEDKIHRSLGEPLGDFAHLEFRGEFGPQAAELKRMRMAHDACYEVVGLNNGISRELFEKRFGTGTLVDSKKTDGPSTHNLISGKLQAHWKTGGKTIDYSYALQGKESPKASAAQPEILAKEARELADADRAMIVEILSKMRDSLTREERTLVRELLDRNGVILQWTAEERRLMIGDQK